MLLIPKMVRWLYVLIIAIIFQCSNGGIIQQEAPFKLLRELHKLMNAEELNHVFGVGNSSTVVDDYEVIYIRKHSAGPSRNKQHEKRNGGNNNIEELNIHEDNHAHYSFTANGKKYNLKLQPNKFLSTPLMKTVIRTSDHKVEELLARNRPIECHYLHVNGDLVAALSHCMEDEIHGYLIEGSKIAEIRPLSQRIRQMLHPAADSVRKNDPTKYLKTSSSKVEEEDEEFVMIGAHILRAVDPPIGLRDRASCAAEMPRGKQDSTPVKPPVVEKRAGKDKGATGKSSSGRSQNSLDGKIMAKNGPNKVLELGIFVDEAATSMFLAYYGKGEYVKLREFILAFVNGMQALYHLPSLGQPIDLAIVYMEMHAKNPAGMPTHNGERGKLLDSFCAYQKGINKPSDSDPEHWDMGLLLSGLDFYAVENGKNNYVTMGLSTVTGVCTELWNCVIGEIGVNNQQGQPYPSTGFTSVYVMAHEIGHNLGISHDSSSNVCPTEGFIMSPSRGVVGETTWSSCSSTALASMKETCMNDVPTGNFPNYHHGKHGNRPGQMWNADEQCKILLRDKAANAYFPGANDLANSCDSMKCKTPGRDGYFVAGPALPGTSCGPSKWCVGGQCVNTGRSSTRTVVAGGWSNWKDGSCTSGCIQNSKGSIVSERECDQPKPSDPSQACQGSSQKVQLCEDVGICKDKVRPSVNDYAGLQCAKFSKRLPVIDSKGVGRQAEYSPSRPWQSCAIYCKKAVNEEFYTPRFELNNIQDLNAFFPDGTWCGKDDQNKDLYCLQRHCVSGDQTKSRTTAGSIPILEIPGNAVLNPSETLPSPLMEYFTLDKDGKPIKDQIDDGSLAKLVDSINQNLLTGVIDEDFITIPKKL